MVETTDKRFDVIAFCPLALAAAGLDPTTTKESPMKWLGTGNLGMLVLAIWLILTGLLPLLHISFSNSGTVMSILAVVAGIMLLLRR
jgi:hypothetical protein